MSGIQIVRFEEFVRVDKAKDVAPIYRHPVTKDEICGETRPSRHDHNKYEFSGFWHSGTYGGIGSGERPAKVPGKGGYILDPVMIVDGVNVRRAEEMAEAGSLAADDRDAVVAYLEERIEAVLASEMYKDPVLNETGKALMVGYLKAGIETVSSFPVMDAVPQPA